MLYLSHTREEIIPSSRAHTEKEITQALHLSSHQVPRRRPQLYVYGCGPGRGYSTYKVARSRKTSIHTYSYPLSASCFLFFYDGVGLRRIDSIAISSILVCNTWILPPPFTKLMHQALIYQALLPWIQIQAHESSIPKRERGGTIQAVLCYVLKRPPPPLSHPLVGCRILLCGGYI